MLNKTQTLDFESQKDAEVYRRCKAADMMKNVFEEMSCRHQEHAISHLKK